MAVQGSAAFQGSETILIVDDEEVCLELTMAMLERFGYHVLTAKSGLETLGMLDLNPPIQIDLAIVDIVMADMTGLEVARELRRLRPGLPVLFVSSFSQNPALRPPHLRDIPFLAKPFSSRTLTTKIRELLTPKSATAGDY